MERKVIVLCCVVGFLGILSAATGFVAEAKRIKGDQVKRLSPSECIYPASPAGYLGVISAFSLLVAHFIIGIGTGCTCSSIGEHQSNTSWTLLALICCVVSRLAFYAAFLLLLVGALLQQRHNGNYYCVIAKHGVFTAGAALSLVSVILGIIYYLMLMATENSRNAISPGGIAMGQPQFPYMRRQFA
ncbi:hypothetical protein DH2020_036856 [Rehmannia glutinosa]|uniref:Uncharacterized protein n=1 Tax=Rehmannia glutinosa TaxID=99300 RepID=A0ABR0V552_REHGL